MSIAGKWRGKCRSLVPSPSAVNPTLLFTPARSTSFFLNRQDLVVDVRRSSEIFRREPRAAVLRVKSGRQAPVSPSYLAALKQRVRIGAMSTPHS